MGMSQAETIQAEFFYRKPLRVGEAKPVFGLSPATAERPDHEAFIKPVKNARLSQHQLSESGFVLLEHDTAVLDFYNDSQVAEIYYPEMQRLAQTASGADVVFIQSHITRNEAEAALGKRLGAHRLVHNDFTPNFKSTIEPLLATAEKQPQRVAVYNLWRRFDADGLDAPFAVCDSRSVSETELIPTDLYNYGDSEGFAVEIYQSSHSNQHEWYFYPKMAVNEVLMFKTYDSAEAPFLPTLHSAFDDPAYPSGTTSARESVEARAICLFY